MKECSACKETKETTEFYVNSKSRDRLDYRCKLCENARKRTPAVKEQRAIKYKENSEVVKENARKYYHRNKETQKARKHQYYLENKEYLNQKCKEYREANKEQLKDKDYQNRYGISLEQFNQMRAEQDYSCFICRAHEDNNMHQKLYVDHDHTTGKVRRLLCSHCNFALGHLRDDRTILARMDRYLRDHR